MMMTFTPMTTAGGNKGNYYYGARYYDPQISIWLSVDPLAHKYPEWSPYTFTGDNPINLIDPDGLWVPGLDDDGNATYTAEKGDNYETLKEHYNLTDKEASKMLDPNSNVVAGETSISGAQAKEATGDEILKLDLSSEMATDQREIDQLVFSLDHSKTKDKNSFKPLDYFSNKDALINGWTGVQGLTGENVTIGDVEVEYFDASIYWNEPINNTPNNISNDGERVFFRHNKQPKIMFRVYPSDSDEIYNRFIKLID